MRVDAGKPNATELLAIAEKLCERTASKREADLDRSTPRRLCSEGHLCGHVSGHASRRHGPR